jgi:hypothetical protein
MDGRGEEEERRLRKMGVGMERWVGNRGEVGSLAFRRLLQYGDHVARKGKGVTEPRPAPAPAGGKGGGKPLVTSD